VALTTDEIRARLAEYDPSAPRCPGTVVRVTDFAPDYVSRDDPDYAPYQVKHQIPCALAAGHAGGCRPDRPVMGWPGYAALSDLVTEVEGLRRQVAELTATGVSIHRHVAAERAAVVGYLTRQGLDVAARDIRDGSHVGGLVEEVDCGPAAGYGRVTAAMRDVVSEYVRGRSVVALGAGSGPEEGQWLGALGAGAVWAVDKAGRHRTPSHVRVEGPCPVTYCSAYGDEFHADREQYGVPVGAVGVVFLKWPDTAARWVDVIGDVPIVIYIGCNRLGTGCGHRTLWQTLARRPILQVVEGARNDLVVYGPPMDAAASAPRCREEIGAWFGWGMG
jgi:hypothetical protein